MPPSFRDGPVTNWPLTPIAAEPRSGPPARQIDTRVRERRGDVHRRVVGEPRLRVERHRLPVVTAQRSRRYRGRAALVAGAFDLDGPAGRQIDPLRPRRLGERLGRDQLAVRAIDHVEEAVLRRVQDRLARPAADLQVGQHDVHVRVEVPGLSRRRLVVPDVFARVGIERDDRAEEQVVAAFRTADLPVPRRAVAGADVELIELRVVGEAMPRVAAAAVEPPLPRPGLRGHAHGLVLEAVRRIPRHDVEAPGLLAGLGVVRRHVAA